MIELSSDSWKPALARIARRHRGVYVVVRIYEGPGEPAGVVLWHTPLQGLRLTDEQHVEIKAGDPVKPIVYTTGKVHAMRADFSEDGERIRELHLEFAEGQRAIVEFGR